MLNCHLATLCNKNPFAKNPFWDDPKKGRGEGFKKDGEGLRKPQSWKLLKDSGTPKKGRNKWGGGRTLAPNRNKTLDFAQILPHIRAGKTKLFAAENGPFGTPF